LVTAQIYIDNTPDATELTILHCICSIECFGSVSLQEARHAADYAYVCLQPAYELLGLVPATRV